MTNEQMQALDGKQGQIEVMITSTGDALEQYQHEQFLDAGALRRQDRKWRVTHKMIWTYRYHYIRFGGGYYSLAHEDVQFIPV